MSDIKCDHLFLPETFSVLKEGRAEKKGKLLTLKCSKCGAIKKVDKIREGLKEDE